MNDTIPDPRSESPELFMAPVKWEQNRLTHSFGTLRVNARSIDFMPGKVSLLAAPFSIPRDQVAIARKRDNFLWRGAVVLHLKEPIGGKDKLVFFLGGRYKEFLEVLAL